MICEGGYFLSSRSPSPAKKPCKTRCTFEKVKKSMKSVWEGDTSMSPRCSEMHTIFKSLPMYLAFCSVFWSQIWAARVYCAPPWGVSWWSKRVIHSKICKKSSNSVWEGHTSMSPRCSEINTIFKNCYMYLAFLMFLEA